LEANPQNSTRRTLSFIALKIKDKPRRVGQTAGVIPKEESSSV
jgi:hypothetical protein